MEYENLCSDEYCWCRADKPVYVNINIPYWAVKDILDNGFINIGALNALYNAIGGKYHVN